MYYFCCFHQEVKSIFSSHRIRAGLVTLERKGFTYCNQNKLEKHFKSILNYDFVPYTASAIAEEKPQYQTKMKQHLFGRGLYIDMISLKAVLKKTSNKSS